MADKKRDVLSLEMKATGIPEQKTFSACMRC
jgi:hypothetical protein